MIARIVILALAVLGALGVVGHQPSPTFNQDIGPIVYERCTPCHRPNGAAPIPLTNYEEVKRNSGLIRIQTLTQAMPPCPVQSDFGDLCVSKPLDEKSIIALQRWIQAGMPEGAAPTPKPSLPPFGWSIGKPSVVIEVGKGYKTEAEGVRYWKAYVVDLPKSIRSLEAFDVIPNKPYSLQNVSIGILPPGRTAANPAVYETFGSLDVSDVNFVGVWSPATRAMLWPDGFAKRLAPGSKLLVQAHYQPTGKHEDAGFRIGVRTGGDRDSNLDWTTFQKREFAIEAEASPDFAFDHVLSRDMRIVAIVPEARFFATRVRLIAILPNGETKNVFENFRWSPYNIGSWSPLQPILLPKGTKLKAILSYANDENCSMNEGKKPERVVSGPRIGDEICRMHLLMAPMANASSESHLAPKSRAPRGRD